uniref:THO1-MOS11 C-terminal domain-containing protein n=1 Tax=Rhizophora mucronata TaxID=61149 RepID=A0A2P2K6S6_RHIMU
MEKNPNKNLDTAVSASDKPDRVMESTSTTADTGKDRPKKDVEDSNSSKVTAVGSLTGNGAPVSDTEKKIRRAERFGITVQLSEEEKRNTRAERFGTGSSLHGSDTLKKSEDLKRKARAERFGLPVQPVAVDEETKKKARLERFASATKPDGQEEEKRKARAARFSQPTPSSLSLNGKGNIEPKAAIMGKAGGGS